MRRILRVVSHFNLSVLANETLSVSLSLEIDNVSGAVRTCFDHVLSKFSGFSWERILFLKSACVKNCQHCDANSSSNRPFARRRHFTTTTRILEGFAFLCKLGLLVFKPQWD